MSPSSTPIDITTLEVVKAAPQARPTLPYHDLDRAPEWVDIAKAVCITDQASYEACVELLQADKALQKAAEAHHRPMISAAYAAHQATCAGLRTVLVPLDSAEAIFKAKIAIWTNEQARIERERMAEARRIEQARRDEELERELMAREAEGAKAEEVQAIITEAAAAPIVVPVVQRTFTAVKGVSTAARYSAEVTSLAEFMSHILKNPMYFGLIQVNQTALDQMARTLKENFKFPGCELRSTTTVTAGRKG